MARAVVVPKFGEMLRKARIARGLTVGQVVARVHMTGSAFEGFTRGQLSRYEAGQTANPDPAVLWRIVQIYKHRSEDETAISVAQLIRVLTEERTQAMSDQEAAESPPAGKRPASGRRTGSR